MRVRPIIWKTVTVVVPQAKGVQEKLMMMFPFAYLYVLYHHSQRILYEAFLLEYYLYSVMVEENSCKRTAGKWCLFLIYIFATLLIVRRCGFSPCSDHAILTVQCMVERRKAHPAPTAVPLSKCHMSMVCALEMCSSQQGGWKGCLQVNELIWSSGDLKTPATTQTKFDLQHFYADLQRLFVSRSGKL